MTNYQQPQNRIVSTTEGRKDLHNLLMDNFGAKTLTAIERNGRIVGVVCPPEVLAILAGDGTVDMALQQRIQRNAIELVQLSQRVPESPQGEEAAPALGAALPGKPPKRNPKAAPH